MDQQTENKGPHAPSCSCGMCGKGACGHMCCGHWGKPSWLRSLIALVIAVLLFVFGFALGRLGGGHFRYSGNMMYRGGMPMMRYYPVGNPGAMMQRGVPPTATSTSAK